MILRLLIIMTTAVLLPVCAYSQEARYKWDIGVGAGMSGYIGDANSGFPFRHPGAAAQLFARYNFDSRWALRAQAGLSSLSGNTADMDNVLPDAAQYSFKSTLYDLSVRGEFNFFPYGIGETYKRLRRWTPVLSIGLGAVMSSVDGKNFTAMEIPLGLGVKYKASPRLNLAIEWTMTKALGDHLDGENLSDLYKIKSSFLKNTDWYSTICVSVTYDFGERCVVCNRKD
ncbi:MAG: porin family protein [Muribaculaceae bacterium]|nr:porin family protein [Muribaculaceae bacterium]